MNKPLLPSGCYDLLPPDAKHEAAMAHTLLSTFERHGYEQVAPPLLEYTESLLAGRGAALSSQTFRVIDPLTNKVMGLRADLTLPVIRLVQSRMQDAPLPLRLSYNGLILRAQGEPGRADRQFRQVGIELIGATGADADAEVIRLAAESLAAAGIEHVTIDLTLPGLVHTLLAAEALSAEQLAQLGEAIAHKDIAAVQHSGLSCRNLLASLMSHTGAATPALAAIEALPLPDAARAELRPLKQLVERLSTQQPEINLTLDITEPRGLEYHSGVCFSVFVAGQMTEVGRGGRYRIDSPSGTLNATGFTLYVETLRALVAAPVGSPRVLVGSDAPVGELHEKGYITVAALEEFGLSAEEARKLGCSYWFHSGTLEKII